MEELEEELVVHLMGWDRARRLVPTTLMLQL